MDWVLLVMGQMMTVVQVKPGSRQHSRNERLTRRLFGDLVVPDSKEKNKVGIARKILVFLVTCCIQSLSKKNQSTLLPSVIKSTELFWG